MISRNEPDFGREHEDPLAQTMPALVVDRQRIVHSAAFRRLQQKTQVFVAPEDDHFRTRLTHTLEVAHQARCLAAALGLNAELAEVVALAHDLGHPPFGHAGERALDECLRGQGGFEHNRQTLRVVEVLEHPYPEFRGLNLTRVVRRCLAAHTTPYDQPGHAHGASSQAGMAAGEESSNRVYHVEAAMPPESAVVDLADRLTYALHDLQDGLYAGLLDIGRLREVGLWREAYTGPAGAEAWRGHLRPAIDRIQARVLREITIHAQPELSGELEALLAELDRFLFTNLYRHPRLMAADEQARRIITDVFEAYRLHPEQLPERFGRRAGEHGAFTVIADYIAGMTDRYCLEQHARLADVPTD